jgi:DivIVA domain-containing protein
MALERDAIVRSDFPVGRRGYDPAAVDAHLQRLADEVAELRRAPTAAAPAGMADAASEQVRAIVAAAEQSAAGIEQAARAEADATLARAGEEARTEVTRVREVVGGLLDRLRTIDDELAAVERSIGSLRPQAAEPSEEVRSDAPATVEEPAPAAATTEPDGDLEGARLVALSMALDGRPRDEVERHLTEHFGIAETDELLDEVYASVAG